MSASWKQSAMELTEKQQEAITLCIDSTKRLVGITGSAGTGKTTILKQAVEILKGRGATSALCAPTGKAAKRITESTGLHAETIHRLLEFPAPGEIDEDTGKPMRSGYPSKCRQRPLGYDFVFVDEAAMVNTDIHRFIVDALKSGAALRYFGDINQLPPIEENKANEKLPSPFRMVLAKYPSVVLDTVHRQAADSGVLFNAGRILRGLPPATRDDFVVTYTDTPVDEVLQISKQVDFKSLINQIIAPTRQGWVGTTKLNSRVQQVINPQPDPSRWMKVPRHPWEKEIDELALCIGDKVVVTKNNYTLNVFNGETGIITEFDHEDGAFVIDFGDREVSIPPTLESEYQGRKWTSDPRKDVDLAYVLTTHKSQGSEFENVCYVMNSSRAFTLNRNNLYTGVTRARKQVYLVSDRRSMTYSLNKKMER
jgi:exodeoxyribonuclease V alpha subunit